MPRDDDTSKSSEAEANERAKRKLRLKPREVTSPEEPPPAGASDANGGTENRQVEPTGAIGDGQRKKPRLKPKSLANAGSPAPTDDEPGGKSPEAPEGPDLPREERSAEKRRPRITLKPKEAVSGGESPDAGEATGVSSKPGEEPAGNPGQANRNRDVSTGKRSLKLKPLGAGAGDDADEAIPPAGDETGEANTTPDGGKAGSQGSNANDAEEPSLPTAPPPPPPARAGGDQSPARTTGKDAGGSDPDPPPPPPPPPPPSAQAASSRKERRRDVRLKDPGKISADIPKPETTSGEDAGAKKIAEKTRHAWVTLIAVCLAFLGIGGAALWAILILVLPIFEKDEESSTASERPAARETADMTADAGETSESEPIDDEKEGTGTGTGRESDPLELPEPARPAQRVVEVGGGNAAQAEEILNFFQRNLRPRPQPRPAATPNGSEVRDRENPGAPATGQPAQPPAPQPDPDPEVIEWLQTIRISGRIGGVNPKVIIDGVLFQGGDTVNPSLGVTFVTVREDAVVFRDSRGLFYRKVE